MTSNAITEDETAEYMWDKIRTNIIASAEKALGTRRMDINGKRKIIQWLTDEVKVLVEQKNNRELPKIQDN
ncbi:hypothetical protein Trydic_g4992 [Trypoxylus dichotomus]